MDGDFESLPQSLGEILRVLSLAAFIPAHMQGLSQKNLTNMPLLHQLVELVEVLPDIGALQSRQPLSGDSEFITDGESDPFLAQIEGEDSMLRYVDGWP